MLNGGHTIIIAANAKPRIARSIRLGCAALAVRNIQPIGDLMDQLVAATQHRQELGLQEAMRVHETVLDFRAAL